MTETIVKDTSIELRRRFRAPRSRVFEAWTTAPDLVRWYAPVKGWVVSRADVDARAGGGYHLEFGPPDGEPIVEIGTYLAFEPPARLVVAVRLEAGVNEGTTVTVEFVEDDDGTEVVIREGEYSSAEVAKRHAGGWSTMLAQLAEIV